METSRTGPAHEAGVFLRDEGPLHHALKWRWMSQMARSTSTSSAIAPAYSARLSRAGGGSLGLFEIGLIAFPGCCRLSPLGVVRRDVFRILNSEF